MSSVLQFFNYFKAFDEQTVLFFSNFRTPALSVFFFVITHFADILVVLCITLLVILVLRKYQLHRDILPFVICVFGSSISAYALKFFFERVRPLDSFYTETLYSFPSGHATTALALYGFIAWLASKHIKNSYLSILTISIFMLIALTVGISRLYLGVHYFTDVLGGFTIALFWLILSAILDVKYFSRKKYWEHADLPEKYL
jgi:undecaprenyl-diphosphatase